MRQIILASPDGPRRPPPAALQARSAAYRSAPAPVGEIIEQILVKVNGDILTKTDLETRQVTPCASGRSR